MQNSEVFQEGLRLRPVKLFRRGELNEEVWNIFADNCRIPSLNWGDITACVASLTKAEQRLSRLAERYGRAEVEQAMYGMLDRTERLTRQVLAQIPQGEYRFTEYFEDDYVSDVPVRLFVALSVRGDGSVELDYTGSDPQVRAALNLPTGSMPHHPFLAMALVNYVVTRSEASLPAGVRRYAQAEIYRRLHITGAGPFGPDSIAAAIAEVGDALGQPVETLRRAAE